MTRGREISISIPEQFNMTSYLLEDNISAGRGEKTAIYYGDEQYTYNDVVRLTNQTGNILKGLGTEPENRVLLVLQDSPEWVAAFFATPKIGAVRICVAVVESAIPRCVTRHNGPNKSITTGRHGLNHATPLPPPTKRLAQVRDVHGQVHFLDECVRPHLAHQIILARQMPVAADENDEDIEGLWSKRNRFSPAQQDCGRDSHHGREHPG